MSDVTQSVAQKIFESSIRQRRADLRSVKDEGLEYKELVFDLYLHILDFLREESDYLPEEPYSDPAFVQPIKVALAYAVKDYLTALKKAFENSRSAAGYQLLNRRIDQLWLSEAELKKMDTRMTLGQKGRADREADKLVSRKPVITHGDDGSSKIVFTDRKKANRTTRGRAEGGRRRNELEVPKEFLEDVIALQLRLNRIQEKYNFPGPVLDMLQYDFANFYDFVASYSDDPSALFKAYIDKLNYMFIESPNEQIDLWLLGEADYQDPQIRKKLRRRKDKKYNFN